MQGTHPAITVNEDLPDVLAGLWLNHKIHSVLVEAGSALSTSAWASGLVDEVFWFQAPVIMGTGIPALADIGVSAMVEARRFTELDVNRVGLDLLIHFTTR
jgi:diaminohydroxyphosphoribosylaminopyrimidine deaminase/5-amino-6-(5-phosphoribosylamino)uracil reductase